MNEKFKRYFSDTPAELSGGIVLGLLVILFFWNLYSGLRCSNAIIRFLFSSGIGMIIAVRVYRTGVLYLDPDRTVRGKFAKILGVVGFMLAVESGILSIMAFYFRYIK